MREKAKKPGKLKIAVKLLVIVLGALVFAAGFQFFHYPNNITSGGVTGIAMIINRLTGLPVGSLIIVLNVPLFLVAWRHFGREFLLTSLLGMGLSSVFVDLLALMGIVATTDPMLGSVIGGVVKGVGLGVIYYVGATTGGTDIVIKFLRLRYPFINFGTMMLLVDAVIIAAYAMILGHYESAMYALIAMYVATKVIDLILYGMDNACLCYVISSESEAVRREIVNGVLHRGVTILSGRGGYTGADRDVLMVVVKRQQIGELRRAIKSIDEHAFFIVTNAKNVFGNGFESISEVR